MKKAFFAIILSAVTLLFVSCEKTKTNEWGRFFGFTAADIAGHYTSSPDESLYQELPTEGVVIYDNVTIDIGATSENSVSLHIVIPNQINLVFSGTLDSEDNSSDLVLYSYYDDLMASVYKNDQGQIRIHGRVKPKNLTTTSIIRSFDVIKE